MESAGGGGCEVAVCSSSCAAAPGRIGSPVVEIVARAVDPGNVEVMATVGGVVLLVVMLSG